MNAGGTRSIRVKICGLRDVQTIRAMDRLPVDEIGFVFAKSKRQVAPALAGELIGEVRKLRTPSGVAPRTVGVFVDATMELLRDVLQTAPLDVVQLHGSEGPGLCAAIRREFGVDVWKVFSVAEDGQTAAGGTVSAKPETADRSGFAPAAAVNGSAIPVTQGMNSPAPGLNAFADAAAAADTYGSARLEAYRGTIDAALIDTAGGGTGRTFAWGAIEAYLEAANRIGVPLYAAGGLHPDNVGELLTAYAPHGVDVSSGVETDGMKDIDKIRLFVERVKRV